MVVTPHPLNEVVEPFRVVAVVGRAVANLEAAVVVDELHRFCPVPLR
jgi:hypothetical protein